MYAAPMIRRAIPFLALMVACSIAPSSAQAGGFEYAGAGTRPLGRGGAFMARADDPMTLRYNPAGLAFLPGYQLALGSHVTFVDQCIQRAGTYDLAAGGEERFRVSTGGSGLDSRFDDPADPGAYLSLPFPRVCRDPIPGPNPQLLFSMRLLPELGIAFGLLTPAANGSSTMGNGDGSVTVDGDFLPSPLRYNIVRQSQLLVWPSIGFGWSPIRELSVGATFMWGISTIDVISHSNSGGGSEDPATDAQSHLSATDWFVPGFVLSVHIIPIDEIDIVAMARISDSIDAEGSLTVTTGVFGTSMTGGLAPFENRLEGATLHAGQPWEFGLGVRYAERRERRYRDQDQAGRVTGRIEDRMQNEVWDLELDLLYTLNSQVTDFVVRPPAGATVDICEEARDCNHPDVGPNIRDVGLPEVVAIPKGWQDQIAIRVGADWNVLPGVLALRAGTHFETSGASASFQGPDTIPGMRLGLHVGATLRIGRFDISVAYAHIFQFDHTVSPGGANLRLSAVAGGRDALPGDPQTCRNDDGSVADYDPEQPVVRRGCYPGGNGAVVNAGTYSVEYNVVSLSMRYHFGD